MQTVPQARRAGDRLRDLFSVTGTATQIEPIARRMLRIRIEGDDISRLPCLPGQHVRVRVADVRDPRTWLRPRDILRSYSVWQHGNGIELCVLDHADDGPGAQWARQLRTGHPVTIGRPEGSFVLGEGAYHLFAGEETAAVTFGSMLRALPPAVPVHGIVEADEPEDRLPLSRELHWQYRKGRSAASSQTLLQAFTELELPSAQASRTWPARQEPSSCYAAILSPNAAGHARPSAASRSGLQASAASTSGRVDFMKCPACRGAERPTCRT